MRDGGVSARGCDTKRRIIKLALALFKEEGYDNVTLARICRRAGISKHTFYHYFAGKDDLLADFRTIPFAVGEDELADLFAEDDPFAVFWRMNMPMIEFFEDLGHELTRRLIALNVTKHFHSFEDTYDMNGELVGIRREMFRAKAALIEKAQKAGTIRNGKPPELLAHMAMMIMLGEVFTWAARSADESLRSRVERSISAAFDVNRED